MYVRTYLSRLQHTHSYIRTYLLQFAEVHLWSDSGAGGPLLPALELLKQLPQSLHVHMLHGDVLLSGLAKLLQFFLHTYVCVVHIISVHSFCICIQ